MEFNIVKILPKEARIEKEPKIDLIELENYINYYINNLKFGSSIETFLYGFELFDFQGEFANFLFQSKSYKSYRWKNKTIIINDQIDYSKFKIMTPVEQFEKISNSILKTISSTKEMKKKPKDFQYLDFKEKVEGLLKNYKDVCCKPS